MGAEHTVALSDTVARFHRRVVSVAGVRRSIEKTLRSLQRFIVYTVQKLEPPYLFDIYYSKDPTGSGDRDNERIRRRPNGRSEAMRSPGPVGLAASTDPAAILYGEGL